MKKRQLKSYPLKYEDKIEPEVPEPKRQPKRSGRNRQKDDFRDYIETCPICGLQPMQANCNNANCDQ